ncbi:MAG: hypothetical protein GY847_07430 [Proteobacteria bacterium]|nr:hypothetical protein [Pseudomonadota bacterium]
MMALEPQPASSQLESDKQIVVDSSSLEIGDATAMEMVTLDVDIAFKLDVKRLTTNQADIGHQLMLVALEVSSCTTMAGINVHHMTDLGVLTFSHKDPDFDDDVICFVENGCDLWVPSKCLRKVWNALESEIDYYKPIQLEPPHVIKRRPLRIAVLGMKYFNNLVSPDINQISSVYLSCEKDGSSNPKRLFRAD